MQRSSTTRTPAGSRTARPQPAHDCLIELRGVSVKLGGRLVLDHVDLKVLRHEIVTLVGLNGSGKTTLVRTLLGLLQPDEGSVFRLPGLKIGFSPQHFHRDATLPLTVARFLTLGMRAPRARLQTLLEEVGAGGLLERQIADISGGEFQRILLARAVLRRPDLLVLDEPLAGVDLASQSELYRLIGDLREHHDCGVLLVSHDLHVVMAATDQVVCLNHHVCCTGQPRAVIQNPEFVSLFGRQIAETLAVYAHHHDHRHDITGEAVPMDNAKRAGHGSHDG
ncbi:MAG: metal ABC transporter ATP-binding protein [Nitrospira sp.]|nr:metal ABC transporter ATP-binding protein [Nitrospira sp.]